MKNVLLLFCLLAASSLVSGEKVLAEWDFLKGKLPDGLEYELRGDTHIGQNGLDITPGDDMEMRGLALRSPDRNLTPNGAFRLEIDFVLAPPEVKRHVPRMVLLDSKYLFKPEARQNGYDSGFAVTLLSGKGQEYCKFEVFLGLTSGLSVSAVSEKLDLEPGEKYHFVFMYHGKGKADFFLNGRKVGERVISNGEPAAHSMNPLVIGDRGMPFYAPFPGTIAKVRIISLQQVPAKGTPSRIGVPCGTPRLRVTPKGL